MINKFFRPLNSLFLLFLLLYTGRPAAFEINFPVTEDTLDNGLKVIMVRDTNVAVVSCRLYYYAGSMFEGPGTSGLSHMYEHMMFKGTKTLGTSNYKKEKPYLERIDSIDAVISSLRAEGIQESDSAIQSLRKQIFTILDSQRKYIKKDQIWILYQNNGGTHLNAWTADDMTGYIVTLPANKIELFYWIESDRMSNPVLREFYSEREVVTEERKMRYENRPLNRYWERLNALFYTAHPYRLPTIGWMSDIRAYSRSKLYKHIKRYYTPDNALLVLNGNIDPEKEFKKIEKYFGRIPRSDYTDREVVTREPPAIGEHRLTVHDNAQPRIDLLFQTPGYPHEDIFKLDVIESILSGESGRLYKKLVDSGLCVEAGAGNAFRLHNGYFHIWATLKDSTRHEEVEKAIIEVIDTLKTSPPTVKEMERIKNNIRMYFYSKLKSLEGLSDQIARFERLNGWKDLLKYPDNIMKIKPESVCETAKNYLTPQKKTIGILLHENPKEKD